MALDNLDKVGDFMPHRAAAGGGGGSVNSVTAGDATITIGGTASDPTVAVTAGTFAAQSTTMTAGNGLTGGGSLAANRTFDVGAGTGISVAADSVAVDQTFSPAWTGVHTWSNTSTPIKSTITDGAAAAHLEGGRLAHTTSTTATAGIGVYLSFGVESGGGTEREAGRVGAILRTVTDAAEQGTLLFQNMQAGTVANAGHFQGTSFFAANAIGIGTVNATGVSTTIMQITTVSSMMQYSQNVATTGGHAFTGTVNTSGARQFFTITPSANTGSTASTEINKFAYNTYTQSWATGALTTQREFCIFAPTYAFTGASTITTAATVYIDGPPIAGTNATITTGHPLWIDSGTPRIDSTSANGTVATVLGSLGPAGSNTTVQEWLTININGTVRYIPCF